MKYRGVLSRRKFQSKEGFQIASEKLLESVEEIAISIIPGVSLDMLQDKSDNKFLELALSCEADFLVTGSQKHFPFKRLENTQIFSPKEYWDRYWK